MITELQDTQLLERIHRGNRIAKETKYRFNGPNLKDQENMNHSRAWLTVSQAILYKLKQDIHWVMSHLSPYI